MFDIELKAVSKKYAGTEEPAVKNLSLAVEKGSIVTLLGPSGCGKSTTLRLIAGFERPDVGSIALAGKVVSDSNTWIAPEKRGVGMVFQDYALFPHLNIFKNIGFGYKANDHNKRITEVIELVNLKGYEKRYPHELSGGQQQRVALARALTRKPVVVLLDEPFSNLDADLRVHMRLEVKRIIKESGATAIFVSHDQKDALAISDSIVVMNEGVVQQMGTPREIYQYPENKFVATFVGQSNILEGKMARDEESVITDLGIIPCSHTHGLKSGEEVYISIRPDSFEMDPEGQIKGRIKESTYTGESIDAVVEIVFDNGTRRDLLTHIHPEKEVKIGDLVRFKVLPHFIAVIRHD
ncbi:MAG: ABC transporter ATP-binding protein [Dethiobacter sp.]|jgi:iron(III) transport system ATP-binding protein|nr:ABC transporter ATP-binding protein [Dethiobacter sp.]